MRFTLLLFTCMSIINSISAMDIKTNTHETDINDQTTPIIFNKKSRSISHWIEFEKNGMFGQTRIFECLDKNGLKQIGTVQTITDSQINRFNTVACVYVDRLEKIYTSDTTHRWIGAFLFYNFNYLPQNPTKTELLQNYYRTHIAINKRESKSSLEKSQKRSTTRRNKEKINKQTIS